jgi:hypothetical protein
MINGWLTGFLMSSYLGKRYICLKQYQPLVRLNIKRPVREQSEKL